MSPRWFPRPRTTILMSMTDTGAVQEYGAVTAILIVQGPVVVIMVVLVLIVVVAAAGHSYRSPSRAGDRTRMAVLRAGRVLRRTDEAALQAIDRFTGVAPARQRAAQGPALVAQLGALAPAGPDLAVAAAARLYRDGPTEVPAPARHRMQVAWMQGATACAFDRTWETMSGMFARGEDALVESLLDTIGAVPPCPVSPTFRDGADRRLTGLLGRPGSPRSHESALAMLEHVAVPDSPGGSPPYWHCALGDAASERGAASDATGHYWKAVNRDFAPARARLAHQLAVEGHQLLVGGRAGTALPLLRTAESLASDPDYRLLTLTARMLAGEAVTELLDELRRLGPELDDAAFWSAVAQLECGDRAPAAHTLRGLDPARLSPSTRDVASALLALAEGPDGILGLATHLLGRYGPRWAAHSPVPADDVVSDVAAREPALLRPLLAGYPADLPLGLPGRLRAARALLTHAVQAEHSGSALEPLELAERLLTEDG